MDEPMSAIPAPIIQPERKRRPWVGWLVFALCVVFFTAPLLATFFFSLQVTRGQLNPIAYSNAIGEPDFAVTFFFSLRAALFTIAASALLVIPTAYWVNLKMPRWRPIIEFLTIMPLVVPAVVLVFGLIRFFNSTPLTNSGTGVYIIMLGAYVIASFPYMYRSVDAGFQAINVRTLTEAAQSLGAGWGTILLRVIFPNVLVAMLNGAFITFAIVMGEFTIASLLSQPAFGPYMYDVSSRKVYEPSAIALVSFGLTWLCVAIIQIIGRGRVRTTVA
jgi:putative spermidine/putrescine transport system permease protein